MYTLLKTKLAIVLHAKYLLFDFFVFSIFFNKNKKNKRQEENISF